MKKIVRNIFIIKEEFGENEDYVNKKIKETKEKSLKTAKLIGIETPHITESFDLHCTNYFSEYPMWLIGPENANKIPKTWQEWLTIGPCKYEIIIREMENCL